jgi:hypothetical protein
MDKASFHHTERIKEMCRDAGSAESLVRRVTVTLRRLLHAKATQKKGRVCFGGQRLFHLLCRIWGVFLRPREVDGLLFDENSNRVVDMLCRASIE